MSGQLGCYEAVKSQEAEKIEGKKLRRFEGERITGSWILDLGCSMFASSMLDQQRLGYWILVSCFWPTGFWALGTGPPKAGRPGSREVRMLKAQG